MDAADADLGVVEELAARLAPGVLADAVAEAREVARARLAQLLAQEITRAACERTAAGAPSSAAGLPSSGAARASVSGPARPESRGDRRVAAERPATPHDGPVPAFRKGPEPGDRDIPQPGGRDEPWASGRDGRPVESERNQALYAYGIVPAGTDVDDLPGLAADTAARAVTRGGVSLVVSAIDPALLRDIDEDLSETGRLAALARGHDQVLRELQDRAAVLPLRFGTVLAGEREAVGVLDDPESELTGALDALRGAREWGFRIDAEHPTAPDAAGVAADEPPPAGYVDAAEPAGAGSTEGSDTTTSPGAGTAYLTARRDELREEERQREEISRLVDRTRRELLAHARDVARRPSRPDRILDCAYLVDRDEEEEFLDAAERLAPPLAEVGYAAVVTGPWPPYSFVHLTLGGNGATGPGAGRGPGAAPGSSEAAAGAAAGVRRSDRFALPHGGRPDDGALYEPGEERD
ncbi:gas vesicle protein GvpFL [Frankia sp. CcI49]|uniref:GvpL/GvpF family gas vesicle protein n=1 Tax=Frankia sp. CcI49 TaxID=1745382 RepID=UPI0009776D4B|nr:GvpL/GvpF family gas vesicle protein [Frankia sp. CcI49]ONH50784.1 gas vesicle protein GvpFL [Frankia sp. CcI49]